MFKKNRYYLQHDSMDCGATCIRMLAKHYGKDLSQERLQEICHTTKEGVSLMSISDTLEELGFKTLGVKLSIKDITVKGKLPCILYWNQQHFVVLFGIKKKNSKTGRKFIVGDPKIGISYLNESEFSKLWTCTSQDGVDKGIALLAEPTESFYKTKNEKNNSNSLSFLFNYFIKYKRFFLQLIFGLFFGSILQLIFPFLTQSIIDIGIKNNDLGFIYLILLAQLFLFIGRMSIDFIRRWILLHISTRINISLISDFFIKLMKLPMSFFDSKQVGDILQRIQDHERVEIFLTSHTLNTLFSFFNFVIFGVVLWIYSIKIFIVLMIGSLLYAIWILFFLKKRRLLDFKRFEQRAINQSMTNQLVYGMQEIKLHNCERRMRWKWENIQTDLFKVNMATLSLEQIQEAGNTFINGVKNILITIIAATSVIDGEMTLGMMLATQYIIGQLNSPIEQSIEFIHALQDTKISLERINDIHNRKEENFDKTTNLNFSKPDIIIKDLVFQYEGPRSKKVINNFNLKIPYGKVTAIVGASGSGKTTLIKLLLQYYQPVSGNILINGTELSNINTKLWRNKCGVVMQDGFVFSESIAQNIAAGFDEINVEKLLYSAKMANIHDFVISLPLKYDTIIGEEGQNLSQGQKQRLLIARAIYKNPDFLFLDEATNALDANNEKKILGNLKSFYIGKTIVIVAHRLSTVQNADLIIVMNDGLIIESGNHLSLIAKKGAYYELVRNQLELGG